MIIAHRKDVLFRDGEAWDTFTNIFSGFGGYSHSELVFSDGYAFTSTTKGPAGLAGAQFFTRQEGYPSWEWSLTAVPATPEQEDAVRAWAAATVKESVTTGSGYDWAGILRFVFPWMKEHPNDWFCSEIVVAALQSIGLFAGLKPWKVSPNRLAKACGL